MRGDQQIRAVGIAVALAAYVARLAFVGNGEIPFLGYSISPFGLLLVVVVLISLPETINMLPFGPTRERN